MAPSIAIYNQQFNQISVICLNIVKWSGTHCLGAAAPNSVLSMGQIELNYVLMVNWIVWNRTVYIYKNRFGIK